jgi:N-sulfoglucosamine sulfohydrolase
MLCFALLPAIAQSLPSRPNIIWIKAEDMSPTLGYFGDKHATHHLAAFARLSILYDNAFASALACSPSPSCIIIGLP